VKTACVVLAAGEGKRMKSPLPKVLHRIGGKTMLGAVLDTVRQLRLVKTIVVAGRHLQQIIDAVGSEGVSFALQAEPLGTGHAVAAAVPHLKGVQCDLLVMNGDTPLISPGTIRKLLSMHRRRKNDISVLSFTAGNPADYGRVVRGPSGGILAIVEDRDADAVQKKITEVNSGVYVFSYTALRLLDAIPMNAAKGEYYLTDVVGIAAKKGLRAASYCIGDEEEFMGVNTRRELQRAGLIMRKRTIERLLESGVDMVDPGTVYVDLSVKVGPGTLVYPNVHLEGNTRVGRNSVIAPNCRVKDSRIGNHVVVRDSTVIEGSEIKDGAAVGPFAHIRPGSVVGPHARIGNFVELKKTVVGRSSKASHLSYLGDARIGKGVNIGAGTITCNYDGVNKHLTVVEDGVFIGSDTQLVAPVRIARGAYVGAGSTITRDVPRDALAVSRVAQQHIPNWVKRRKKTAVKK